MYDTVLVATDGSDHAAAATEHAVALAAEHDATVHAVFVVDTSTNLLTVSKDDVRDALRTVREDESERALAAAATTASDAGVPAETHVYEGEPSEQLLAAVDDLAADVVVLGTHGHTGLRRRLLGSVSEQVVRHAPVPVVTIGPDAQ
jgi:nucleotide-binding universal stress UspA family protein